MRSSWMVQVVGVQDINAEHFATLRSVHTGSWLGLAHQGQGLGKEMRQAILHLAFAGLGALEAHSGAFFDNEASLATSRSVGYGANGEALAPRRAGAGADDQRPHRPGHVGAAPAATTSSSSACRSASTCSSRTLRRSTSSGGDDGLEVLDDGEGVVEVVEQGAPLLVRRRSRGTPRCGPPASPTRPGARTCRAARRTAPRARR